MQSADQFASFRLRCPLCTAAGVTWLTGDHLGSASLATNAAGQRVSEERYYPYGTTRVVTGTMPTDYQFTGQKLDSGTGLYYYGARYYDPVVGRFVSADSIVPSAGSPQDLNRYAYTRNNPVRYTDPSGHYVFEDEPDDPSFRPPTWYFDAGMRCSGTCPSPDAEREPVYKMLAQTGPTGAAIGRWAALADPQVYFWPLEMGYVPGGNLILLPFWAEEPASWLPEKIAQNLAFCGHELVHAMQNSAWGNHIFPYSLDREAQAYAAGNLILLEAALSVGDFSAIAGLEGRIQGFAGFAAVAYGKVLAENPGVYGNAFFHPEHGRTAAYQLPSLLGDPYLRAYLASLVAPNLGVQRGWQ